MNDRILQLESFPADVRNCVLTIGNFDGVHVGHQRIIEIARPLAANNGPVVALTFNPPPDLVLRPADAPLRLTPHEVKCRLLIEAGCDYVVTEAASQEILSLTPDEFAERIIVSAFGPRHMVEGPNFFFGKKRAGNVETLREIGQRNGFEVHVADPIRMELSDDETLVSSTRIRGLVGRGQVAEATRCMGRPFTLYGKVIRGRGLGRKLEYPTANIQPTGQVIPADGVYAGYAEIAGKRRTAAISVGTAPTFNSETEGQRLVEAHLLSTAEDLYGQSIAVAFVERLREQRRYDNPEALKTQMARDVEQVRMIVPE